MHPAQQKAVSHLDMLGSLWEKSITEENPVGDNNIKRRLMLHLAASI